MPQRIRDRARDPKTINLVGGVKFCSAVLEEKSKIVPANQRPGRPS